MTILDAKGRAPEQRLEVSKLAPADQFRAVGNLLGKAKEIFDDAKQAHETNQPLMRQGDNGLAVMIAPGDALRDVRKLEAQAMTVLESLLWDLVGPKVLAAMGNLHVANQKDLQASMSNWADEALRRRGWEMDKRSGKPRKGRKN